MSTTDYLEYTTEESLSARQHVDLEEAVIQEMIQVVQGQRAEADAPSQEFGWFDCFCFDCPAQGTSPCPQTIREFAHAVINHSWFVSDLGRSQVLCPACSNPTDEPSEYEEWLDSRVYEERKQ